MGICYGCAIAGRMIKECPNTKKKNERWLLHELISKRNTSESEEEKMKNHCIMAEGDLEEEDGENSEDVTLNMFSHSQKNI